MGDISTLLSHTAELNVKLTLKQDDAKNERRSLPTTFSINRRRGSMCAFGAVLGKNDTKEGFLFIIKTAKSHQQHGPKLQCKRAGEYREDMGETPNHRVRWRAIVDASKRSKAD